MQAPNSNNYSISPSEEYARRLFLNDPFMSINEVARVLDQKGLGMHKHELGRVRREVKERITAAQQGQAQTPQLWKAPYIRRNGKPQYPVEIVPAPIISKPEPEPLPFNPPRIAKSAPPTEESSEPKVVKFPDPTPAKAEEPQRQQVVKVAPAVPVKNRAEALKFKEVKKSWLESWLLDHPEASINKARQAVLGQFQETLSTDCIVELVRMVRAVAGQGAQHPQEEKPKLTLDKPLTDEEQEMEGFSFDGSLIKIIEAARRAGITKLELMDNGHYAVQVHGQG